MPLTTGSVPTIVALAVPADVDEMMLAQWHVARVADGCDIQADLSIAHTYRYGGHLDHALRDALMTVVAKDARRQNLPFADG